VSSVCERSVWLLVALPGSSAMICALV
jgi:hypothetical protein